MRRRHRLRRLPNAAPKSGAVKPAAARSDTGDLISAVAWISVARISGCGTRCTQIDSRSPGPSGQSWIQDFRIQGCPDPKEARSGAATGRVLRALYAHHPPHDGLRTGDGPRDDDPAAQCDLQPSLVPAVIRTGYSFNKCPQKHELTGPSPASKRHLNTSTLTRPVAQRRDEDFEAAVRNAQGEANDYLLKLRT